MLSNANTKPISGKDLIILDIILSLENPRLPLGFFRTIHDIENFKIFFTNGFSIVSLSVVSQNQVFLETKHIYGWVSYLLDNNFWVNLDDYYLS